MFAIYVETLQFLNKIQALWNTRSMLLSIAQESNQSCVCGSAHIWQTYSTTGAVFVFQLTPDNIFFNRSCVCASAHTWQRILQSELCLYFSSHLTTYSTTGAVFVLQLTPDKRILQPELCLCFSSHMATYSTTGAVFVLQLKSDNVFYSCTFDRLATDPYRPS